MKNEHAKFYIDLKKLPYNILHIKYKANNCNKTRPIEISEDAKDVILDILQDKFNQKIFDKLPQPDQIVIEQAGKIMNWNDIGLSDKNTMKLYKEFQILKGSWLAGNNSIEVKNSLKEKIFQLMELKRISYMKAMQLIFELSLG
jgi:hypothetical protein